MRKQAKYHHGDLKQSLVVSAQDMIARDGVNALSLRKLASAIGVNQTALYSHFKSKNQLLAELARQGYAELTKSLQVIREAKHGPERLMLELSTSYVAFARSKPEIFKLMFSPSFSDLHRDDPELWAVSETSFQIYEEIIAQYVSVVGGEQRVKLVALAAWSFMHGFCHLLLGDRLSRDTMKVYESGALLKGLVEILENGIAN